jgi:hypothetical protein
MMSPTLDSLLRREQLVELALKLPASEAPTYDKAYYYALREAHRPHIRPEDWGVVRSVEELVGRRIKFAAGVPQGSQPPETGEELPAVVCEPEGIQA